MTNWPSDWWKPQLLLRDCVGVFSTDFTDTAGNMSKQLHDCDHIFIQMLPNPDWCHHIFPTEPPTWNQWDHSEAHKWNVCSLRIPWFSEKIHFQGLWCWLPKMQFGGNISDDLPSPYVLWTCDCTFGFLSKNPTSFVLMVQPGEIHVHS